LTLLLGLVDLHVEEPGRRAGDQETRARSPEVLDPVGDAAVPADAVALLQLVRAAALDGPDAALEDRKDLTPTSQRRIGQFTLI
jgi:hypothetical protein